MAGKIGCAVLQRARSGVTGHVLSVFDRSAHLKSDDAIITLGTLEIPNHPFTIRTPHFPAGIREELRFDLSPEEIVIPGLYREDLSAMETFEPRTRVDGMVEASSMYSCLQETRRLVATASFKDGFHSFVIMSPMHGMITQAVLPVLDRLMETIRKENWPAMAASAVDLAGVGEGLTPSGDDFLVGLVAALRFHRVSGGPGPELDILTALASEAGGRTSAFSAQNILSAAEGLVSEDVSDWLVSFHLGDLHAVKKATTRLLNLGHSSGVDTFAGMSMGLSSVLGIGH